jgi:hypothetical protein
MITLAAIIVKADDPATVLAVEETVFRDGI